MYHVGIDHDEIANCQGSFLHADGGHHHHADEPAGDQKGLTKIQESQRVCRFQRCPRIGFHRCIISLSFALFRIEILDSFKVQKAVNGALVGLGILIVHFATQLYAPLCHREGEPDIQRDGDCHDDQVPNVEHPHQDDRDQQQLKDQRSDREQQEP